METIQITVTSWYCISYTLGSAPPFSTDSRGQFTYFFQHVPFYIMLMQFFLSCLYQSKWLGHAQLHLKDIWTGLCIRKVSRDLGQMQLGLIQESTLVSIDELDKRACFCAIQVYDFSSSLPGRSHHLTISNSLHRPRSLKYWHLPTLSHFHLSQQTFSLFHLIPFQPYFTRQTNLFLSFPVLRTSHRPTTSFLFPGMPHDLLFFFDISYAFFPPSSQSYSLFNTKYFKHAFKTNVKHSWESSSFTANN